MRGTKATTRRRIVDAAYESFWRSGFARTGVDGIAARAGLTKRTLYAHFRSKDDLLAAVLQQYAELAMVRLRRIGERLPADPEGMIDGFFGQLAGWAGTTPRWSGSGFTRLVVELADRPGHPARAIARRAKATTEAWLAGLLASAGLARPAERARDLMLLLEGAMALTLIHGGRAYIDAAAQAARRLATKETSAKRLATEETAAVSRPARNAAASRPRAPAAPPPAGRPSAARERRRRPRR